VASAIAALSVPLVAKVSSDRCVPVVADNAFSEKFSSFYFIAVAAHPIDALFALFASIVVVQ
jgi:hypothetical protein